MSSHHKYLLTLLASWLILSAGVALALVRGVIGSGTVTLWQVFLPIVAAGGVPLGWLGLSGGLTEAARRLIERPAGIPTVLVVLQIFLSAAGAGMLILALLFQIKVGFECSDVRGLRFGSAGSPPVTCGQFVWVWKYGQVFIEAEGYEPLKLYPAGKLKQEEGGWSKVPAELRPVTPWLCRASFTGAEAAEICGGAPAETWATALNWRIRIWPADKLDQNVGLTIKALALPGQTGVALQATNENCRSALANAKDEARHAELLASSEGWSRADSAVLIDLTVCSPEKQMKVKGLGLARLASISVARGSPDNASAKYINLDCPE